MMREILKRVLLGCMIVRELLCDEGWYITWVVWEGCDVA